MQRSRSCDHTGCLASSVAWNVLGNTSVDGHPQSSPLLSRGLMSMMLDWTISKGCYSLPRIGRQVMLDWTISKGCYYLPRIGRRVMLHWTISKRCYSLPRIGRQVRCNGSVSYLGSSCRPRQVRSRYGRHIGNFLACSGRPGCSPHSSGHTH